MITKIVSRRKFGFSIRPLNVKKEPHPVFYISQRSSFWIATLSLLAFMVGNMVGQHGWYLFWASVMGKEEIIYTGTVSPIEKVPNYTLWSSYGGDISNHTFRQVPAEVLIPLPNYTKNISVSSSVYSVSFMGDYKGAPEGSGSHPGVDIRVPIGTPVRSIANGIVHEVKSGGGFGNVITIRHPNVPNPSNPKKTTTLYSSYAHLNTTGVTVGMVVSKGEEIGTSGQTGFASGPHLHFQIDKEDAPWLPYWPFSSSEQYAAGMNTTQAVNAGLHSERGYEYSISPLLYVQANYSSVPENTSPSEKYTSTTLVSSVEQRRADRLRERGAVTTLLALYTPEVPKVVSVPQQTSSVASTVVSKSVIPRLSPVLRLLKATEKRISERMLQSSNKINPVVISSDSSSSVVAVNNVSNDISGDTLVSGINFHHDGSFSGREWEKITLTLLDSSGHTVTNPILPSTLYLRTAYGEADFKPSELNALDFVDGEVSIYILPRGRRTVVIQAKPFADQSTPMIYEDLVASY